MLARSIPAIELLGATTVLCVDKTGTLISNRMRLRRLWSEGRPTRAARRRQAFDRMEAAIGAAGARLPENTEHLHADWALIDDYPLSRQMLAMSRVWRSPGRQDYVIAAKGEPLTGSELDGMDAAAAVSLLLVALGVPGLRQLFAFAVPAPGPLLLCCVVAAATLAWCALLRRILASLSSGPR